MKKVDKNLIKFMCSDLVKYRDVDLNTLLSEKRLSEKGRIKYHNLWADLNKIVSPIGFLYSAGSKDDANVLFLKYPLFDYYAQCAFISFETIDELISCISSDIAIFDSWNDYRTYHISLDSYSVPNLSVDELRYAYDLSISTGKYFLSDEIKKMYSSNLYCVVDENNKSWFTGSKQKCEQFIKSLRIRKV